MENWYVNGLLPQRALLVAANTGSYDVEISLNELSELAQTAGAIVICTMIQNMQKINNATFVGKGKLEELKELCIVKEIDLVIFDDELSGMQIKNIEEAIEIEVIDRTMLILDIFANRALSGEGKLQVELAQQKYLLPRLIGVGEKLSKQQGGIGSRGPGETKLETDRRHIRKRIELLEEDLKELEFRRERLRKRRKKNDIITIAIVGYTNVGKSTLLNLLTNSNVLAKNQLFATLDPTVREIKLKDGQPAILIDTVGLIRRLPHQLIKAFKSTLEEAASADIILNVCDISSDQVRTQIEVTNQLLSELNCSHIPVITVYNKMDMIDMSNIIYTKENEVFISATKNLGIEKLYDEIAKILSENMQEMSLLIPYSKGDILDKIRQQGRIYSEKYEEDGTLIHALIEKKILYLVDEYKV